MNLPNTVFIVEDDPISIALLTAILEQDEYRIQSFNNPEDVISAAGNTPPSLFLLDVMMSGMDGFELCRLIKQQPTLAAIPIIFITGLNDEKSIEEGFSLGAVDYIPKPLKSFEILARVRLHIQLYDTTRRLEREIEERALMEMELRQAQKLEAVGQLAAGIAHEINTPIQFVGDSMSFLEQSYRDIQQLISCYRDSIMAVSGNPGYEQALREIENTENQIELEYLEDQVPKSFDRVADGISRVSSIVNAMRNFAHPNMEENQAADINQMLIDTLTIARSTYKYVADLEIELQQLPPVVCQQGNLNQAFLNIIVNAAHAIEEQFNIDGKKGRITVKSALKNNGVKISISDTGSGISKENHNRVYDPFFTTKEPGMGTGQGLSISRKIIVDQHGGTLKFETQMGKGTTFRIRIPVKKQIQNVEKSSCGLEKMDGEESIEAFGQPDRHYMDSGVSHGGRNLSRQSADTGTFPIESLPIAR